MRPLRLLIVAALSLAGCTAAEVRDCGDGLFVADDGKAFCGYCTADTSRCEGGVATMGTGVVVCAPSASPAAVSALATTCASRPDGGGVDGGRDGGPAGSLTSLTAGSAHTCLIAGERAYCWGDDGRMQRGSPGPIAMPVTQPLTSIVAGVEHTCVQTTGGETLCFGRNAEGQLGTDSGVDSAEPFRIGAGLGQLAAGEQHTLAIDGADVVGWGTNLFGILGENLLGERVAPVGPVVQGRGYTALASSVYHACGLTGGGAVDCWGANAYAQVGETGGNRTTPFRVVPSDATAVTTGSAHSCAIVMGQIQCWGMQRYDDEFGPELRNYPLPVDVTARSLAGGWQHTCALTDDDRVFCWGTNDAGQLGDSTFDERRAPVEVAWEGTAPRIRAIAAGSRHTCALAMDDAVYCWGANDAGQLGVDTSGVARERPQRLTPAW
ncbi:MAG: hypothetical protein KC619_10540 [Myxococcales bacterium]|nr:hypothetical protein [Myxococcales bacterium]